MARPTYHLRSHMLQSLACAGCVVFLFGCAVGPDYKPPAEPKTQAFLSADEKAGTTTGASAAAPRWWQSFGSQDLNQLVDAALAGNPSLAASDATLLRVRAEEAAAEGKALPQISANARAEREEVNFAAYGFKPSVGASTTNPEFNLYTVGGGVFYDLDLFGRHAREIEQAEASSEAQLHRTEAAHLSVAGQVAIQAITLAAIRARIANAEKLIEEDRHNVELTDHKRIAGTGTLVEVLRAQSQQAADEADLPALQQSLSEARHLLAILIGKAPGDFTLPELDLDSLTLPGVPATLPSELVHRRPDILQAESELHAATAAIGVATAKLFPDITLGATLSQAAPNVGNVIGSAFRGYDLFAGLTAPIFNGGTLEAGRQAAIAQARVTDADYQETVLKAFAQVADLLTALDHDRRAVEAQQQSVDIAQKSLNLSRRSFEVGNSTVLDIIDAERLYQRAMAGLVEAKAKQYLDTVRLIVATAGGWPGADVSQKS